MQILPLMYLETLDDEAIARHNCSDRIWFHTSAFERWISNEAGTVTLVQLQNRVTQSVTGCVFGVHQGNEDILYVPQWMYDALDFDTEHVDIARTTPSMCTGIVLQPHTSDHIRAADPQEFLRDGFEQYSTLTPGQTLDLWVGADATGEGGYPMTCTVLSLLPSNETLAIRNCEMTLELMAPLDLPIPEPPGAPAPAPAPAPPTHVESSSPPLPVVTEDPAVRRQRLAEAARARARGAENKN